MKIRPVETRDWEAWLSLRGELWPDGTPEAHQAEMHQLLENSDFWTTLVSATAENQLVGFAEVSLRQDAESIERSLIGYLEGWYVVADHRGQGIGRRLVEAAEIWVLEHGCTVMESDAAIDNEQSHRAHAALGFAETSREVRFRKTLRWSRVRPC